MVSDNHWYDSFVSDLYSRAATVTSEADESPVTSNCAESLWGTQVIKEPTFAVYYPMGEINPSPRVRMPLCSRVAAPFWWLTKKVFGWL